MIANYEQQDRKRHLKKQERKEGVWSKSRVLCMPTALNTTKGVGKPPKSPLQSNLWTHPYKRNKLSPTSQHRWVGKGTCYLLLLPAVVAGVPIKPFPNLYQFPSNGEGQKPCLVTILPTCYKIIWKKRLKIQRLRSPAQAGCMRQVIRPGALGRLRGTG